jgi:pyruvate kinase
MIAAGMNVARLNLSHGSLDAQGERLTKVRRAAEAAEANIAVMVDTRGREVRLGKVEGGAVELTRGQEFVLYNDARIGSKHGASVSLSTLHEHVKPHDSILADDGIIGFVVTKVADEAVHCRVECGGTLRSNKGMNLPDNPGAFDALVVDDTGELEFAVQHDVEYLAASFIRSADDVERIRARLDALDAHIPIIAKIESRGGVRNLDKIVATADGTMVARGDLGVELDLAQGPAIQKKIIHTTVTNGKPVITATQMLDSMERNPRPTRAEVSDVANAILDGTSAVMLSGETAAGAYPVEAVRTMVRLALEAEAGLEEYGHLQQILPNPSNVVTEAVAQASIAMAAHLKAAAIIALTETGFTSRLISKYRPGCPILAVTSSARVVRRLAMNWGVRAIHYDRQGSDEDKLQFATSQAKQLGYAHPNDIVIATTGSSRQAGSTDLIRVLSVD